MKPSKVLKVFAAILSVCLICSLAAACGGGTPVELSFAKESVEVFAGSTVTVKAIASRDLVKGEEIVYSSDKESVATVDKTGRVKGVSVGEATITAKIGDASATCKIVVKKKITLSLDITEKTLNVEEDDNKTVQLTASCNEEGKITFTSSDENVATVDDNGLVTAVVNDAQRRSTATITASAHGLTATCVVTVINPSAPEVYDIQRNPTNANIAKDPGKWFYFNKTSDGAQIANPTATYNSSKENGDNITITYAYIGATNTAGQTSQNYLRYQPDLPVDTQYVFSCTFTSTVAGQIEIGTGNIYDIPENAPVEIVAVSTVSSTMPLNIKLLIFGGTEEEPANIVFALNNIKFTPHTEHSFTTDDHKCEVCGAADPNPTHVYDPDSHKCTCGATDPDYVPEQGGETGGETGGTGDGGEQTV